MRADFDASTDDPPLEDESLLAGDYFRLIAAVAFGGSLAIGFTACPGPAEKATHKPERPPLSDEAEGESEPLIDRL